VERADGRRVAELVAIANSGFASPEPEAVRKALGDGSEAVMLRCKDAVNM
jgi:hypothetical protein